MEEYGGEESTREGKRQSRAEERDERRSEQNRTEVMIAQGRKGERDR